MSNQSDQASARNDEALNIELSEGVNAEDMAEPAQISKEAPSVEEPKEEELMFPKDSQEDHLTQGVLTEPELHHQTQQANLAQSGYANQHPGFQPLPLQRPSMFAT